MAHRNDLLNWKCRSLFMSVQNYLQSTGTVSKRFWLKEARLYDLDTIGGWDGRY